MIISIFTQDNNNYLISNDSKDGGSPYVLGENALYISLTNPCNLFFSYKNAKIVIPYDRIVNVIYNDRVGEELAAFVLSKKNNGEIVIPPNPDPEHTPSTIMRDKRVLGEQVYQEIPILVSNYTSNVIRDKRVLGGQVYHEIPILVSNYTSNVIRDNRTFGWQVYHEMPIVA